MMTAITKWITSASDSDPISFLSKLLFIIVVIDLVFLITTCKGREKFSVFSF